jgi:hypothetical protein
MWRAEFRVAGDAVNSFSRDMAMGVLAYLIATRDKELGKRWLEWIENNGNRLCRESSDNRCEFSPGFWSLFRDVWNYLDLPLSNAMTNSILDDAVVTLLQAQIAPEGYQLHLAGVNLFLRRSLGQKNPALDALAQSLLARQKMNPFFAYLAEGPTANVIEKTLAWCPAAPPPQRTEWSFERDELERPWERSMGWECVFLINSIVRDTDKLSRSGQGQTGTSR